MPTYPTIFPASFAAGVAMWPSSGQWDESVRFLLFPLQWADGAHAISCPLNVGCNVWSCKHLETTKKGKGNCTDGQHWQCCLVELMPAAAYLQISSFVRKINPCYFKPLLIGFSVTSNITIALIISYHPEIITDNTSGASFQIFSNASIAGIFKRLFLPNTCYLVPFVFYAHHLGIFQALLMRDNK